MRIAMSLLRQCAWVWEHCTRNPNEGEFRLSEVLQGLHGNKCYESAPGIIIEDMGLCEHWDVFISTFAGDGGLLGFSKKTWETRMEFGNFRFSYRLDNIFDVTSGFCKLNCPSMRQKVRFCAKGGERWAVLPEVKKTKAKTPSNSPRGERKKKAATKTKAIVKPMPAAKPLTLAEQLRQALLARMAA